MSSYKCFYKIKVICTLFISMLTLTSCGFNAQSSGDYSEYERPHYSDIDYVPYHENPIYNQDRDIETDNEASDDDIVIVVEGDSGGQSGSNSPKIEHCIDTSGNANLIQSFKNENEFDAFNIALYITGTFEGKSAWANITNNFDGQGLSLGRFQQNLGQGSLQPLLIRAISENPGILDRHFSKEQKQSLLIMLNTWLEDDKLVLASLYKNPLRFIASLVRSYAKNEAINPRSGTSVDWAIKTLYSENAPGETFKSNWKNSFTSLALDPDYLKIQREAAIVYHERALNYMKVYATTSLVSYLFFFDVIVQNGSMSKIKYTDALAQLSEGKKLEALLELRAKKSKKKYQADVLERKGLILAGHKFFRGKDRSLSQETCLPKWSKISL